MKLPGFYIVFRRELAQYLKTPGTYVALAFFFLLSGALFVLSVWDFVELSNQVRQGKPLPEGELPLDINIRVVSQLFLLLHFLFLMVIPMLTMGLIADEKKRGTFDLLLTTPLRDLDIVLGKFLAVSLLGLAVLAGCGLYLLLLWPLRAPDPGVVAAAFVGLALVIPAYAALGLFTSSLSDNAIVAAALAFVGLLLFQFFHFFFKTGLLGRAAAVLSVHPRLEPFTQGVFNGADAVYLLSFAAFFLFLTLQTLALRHEVKQ